MSQRGHTSYRRIYRMTVANNRLERYAGSAALHRQGSGGTLDVGDDDNQTTTTLHSPSHASEPARVHDPENSRPHVIQEGLQSSRRRYAADGSERPPRTTQHQRERPRTGMAVCAVDRLRLRIHKSSWHQRPCNNHLPRRSSTQQTVYFH